MLEDCKGAEFEKGYCCDLLIKNYKNLWMMNIWKNETKI